MAVKNRRTSVQREARIKELLATAQEHYAQGKRDLACKNYSKALQLDPKSIDALLHLGQLLMEEKDFTTAEQHLKTALLADKDNAAVHAELGRACGKLGQALEERKHYNAALRLDPHYANTYNYLGQSLSEEGNINEALDAFQSYLKLEPECVIGHINLANALVQAQQTIEAIKHYQHVLSINEKNIDASLQLAKAYQKLCAWNEVDKLRDFLRNVTQKQIKKRERPTLSTYDALQLLNDDNLSEDVAQAHAMWHTRACRKKKTAFEIPLTMRMRVAYLLNEKDEELMLWLGEQLALHDKERFEIYVYTDVRMSRFRKQADVIIYTGEDSYAQIAKKIRARKMQILIDLIDYTGQACSEVIFHKPAPIQCQLFRYPSLLGANVLDHLISDKSALPKSKREKYEKQLVLLKDSSNSAAPLSQDRPVLTRTELGLPEDMVVFCNLNDTRWINEETLTCWFCVMQQVPNSILWLMSSDNGVQNQLRTQAQAVEINPKRLHFAPQETVYTRYLMQLADIWLDNMMISDKTAVMLNCALGIPSITYQGKTIATRLGAQIAASADLSDLITKNKQQYVELAVMLGTDTEKREYYKQRLLNNPSKLPLFNNQNFIKQLEKKYRALWRQYQAEYSKRQQR